MDSESGNANLGAFEAYEAFRVERMPLVWGEQTGQIIAPILADGEIVGCLMLAERESGVRMTAVDMKVAETTAVIIGRQMEQ